MILKFIHDVKAGVNAKRYILIENLNGSRPAENKMPFPFKVVRCGMEWKTIQYNGIIVWHIGSRNDDSVWLCCNQSLYIDIKTN